MEEKTLTDSAGTDGSPSIIETDTSKTCRRCYNGELLGGMRYRGTVPANTAAPDALIYECPECGREELLSVSQRGAE